MRAVDQTLLDQIPKAVVISGNTKVIAANQAAIRAYGPLLGSDVEDLQTHITERTPIEDGQELLELKLVCPDQIPFTLLFDDSATANLLCDYDWNVVRVNEAFATWSGFSCEDIEGEMSVGDFIPPEDRAVVYERAQRRIRGEDLPAVHDFRGLTRSGEIQHVRVRAVLVPGLPYVIYSILDLGPTLKTLQSEARYQNLLEHCGSGIVIVKDNTFDIVYANREMQRLVGYSEAEALSMNGFDILSPGAREAAIERTRQRQLGDPSYTPMNEYELIRKDGTLRQMLSITSEIPNSDQIMLAFFDISERKQAERELAIRLEQEKLLSKLQQEFLHVDAGNLSERLQTALEHIRVSFQADRLVLNLFRPDCAGTSWSTCRPDAPQSMVVGSEVLHLIEETTAACLLGGNSPVSEDAQSFLSTMEKYGVKQFAVAPYETAGDRYRLTLEKTEREAWTPERIAFLRTPLALIANMMERIKAEQEQARLQRQVWEGQKLESIGVLAGGIAHDFNNMLTAMLGNAEMAMENLSDREAAEQCLGDLLLAGDRARMLVSQILAFARHSDTLPEPVNLNEVCEEAKALLRASIPTTIELHVHPRFNAAWVLGDSTQLLQVIMNLCTNAYQAIGEQKGAQIHLSTEPVALEEDSRLDPERTYAKVVVEDTGPGIPSEDLERIFDPFFTTKNLGEGTGMGLSMVHGIVTHAEGHVAVANTSRGARFTIFLPLTDQRPLKTVARKTEVLKGNSETILVVDDDDGVLKLVTSMLRSLDYRVECFSEPQAAVHCFQRSPEAFDLVITDLTMPGLTGNEVAEHIKACRAAVPVIAISGYSQAGADMGVIDAFLPKPFQRVDLATTLQAALAEAPVRMRQPLD